MLLWTAGFLGGGRAVTWAVLLQILVLFLGWGRSGDLGCSAADFGFVPGWGWSSVCGVCVSVTALASATNALKAKVRYQQKALDAGNKINVGIELKFLGSKVVTVIGLP